MEWLRSSLNRGKERRDKRLAVASVATDEREAAKVAAQIPIDRYKEEIQPKVQEVTILLKQTTSALYQHFEGKRAIPNFEGPEFVQPSWIPSWHEGEPNKLLIKTETIRWETGGSHGEAREHKSGTTRYIGAYHWEYSKAWEYQGGTLDLYLIPQETDKPRYVLDHFPRRDGPDRWVSAGSMDELKEALADWAEEIASY